MLTITTRRRPVLLLVLSLVPLAAGACSPPTEPYRASTGTPIPAVTIEPAEVVLAVGQRVQLVAFVSGSGADRFAVEWVSTDPLVATIAPDGTLKGIAAGSATIIAIAGEGRGVAEVAVSRGRSGRPSRPPLM